MIKDANGKGAEETTEARGAFSSNVLPFLEEKKKSVGCVSQAGGQWGMVKGKRYR